VGKNLSVQKLFGLIFFLVLAALGAGYYIQHGLGIEPCPLCIVQRLAFVAVGTAALVGLMLATRRTASMIVAVITSLLAMAGAGVAAWHLWIKAHPPESFSCGRPFAWMMENMPLTDVLPKLFKGEADCLQETWTLLGLGIPHWSLLLFLVLMALADYALIQVLRAKKQ
jgi:disulfide bond formation protein DsbB